jgi:hypothetical protein
MAVRNDGLVVTAARDYERGFQRRQRNRFLLNALVFVLWFAAVVTFPMWGSLAR